MAESERDKKQAFLRKTIIEAGYDAEKFVSIMGVRRGIMYLYFCVEGGENIDNWSFGDLQDIVEEFTTAEGKGKGQEAHSTIEEIKASMVKAPECFVDLNV